MRTSKLFWQLFPSQLLVLLGAILLISWHGSLALQEYNVEQKIAELEARSRLIQPRIAELFLSGDFQKLEEFCRASGRPSATRITVLDQNGTVVGDSIRDPESMDNHRQRPEIITALAGKAGSSRRYSATTDQNMLYVAIPLESDNRIRGVLRTAIAGNTLDTTLNRLFWRIGLGFLVVSALAAWVTLLAARRVSRPLEEMTGSALRFAAGDFSERMVVSGSEEVVSLAQAMNRMAVELDVRLKEAENRRKELETVVSSMLEGVIAVDQEAKVLYLNGAAARQLDVSRFEARGANILEVVRNIDLLRFIQKTLAGDDPVEGTVLINRGREDERVLQLRGAQLFDADRKRIGALIVCNDVTRLLRLENLRRDFVANVSHELKTPITSIKGYVETLLPEAKESQHHFREFLGIILKQANRLQAIVEDLLTLSRIEQEGQRQEILLTAGSVKAVLAEAIEACAAKAADKPVEISLDCPDNLTARINAPLLEQAISNLLDNAIKYSRPESTVRVEAEATSEAVAIRVCDTGPGIPEQHLPRLFERFYVIDKARSRKMGGTGLGLAIVKHIVQSHGGQVTVASKMGQGSVFTITLPRPDSNLPPG